MRFARLRLNGFKSFVDPTDLVIHDGLTGVVGPNGCGKSNLLEALRWVMGENRPTAMRGAGMEDVIFAGSGGRGARAFAEVALSIDNSERLAPSGFNEADQLEVVRRITRDAGSAYRVNGREVRARDVQMLFADASTGAHSPALVRQGQISELINAKPRARRRILEEAAGISGLYQRRHEAELRLSATEQNLTRVEDVVENLATQLAALQRQARAAARYREIAAALRRVEAGAMVARWREAGAVAEEAQAELNTALRGAGQAEAAARAAAQARAEAEDALPPRREEEAIAGAILQRLSVQRDQLDEEDARARDRIATLSARIVQLDRDAEREAGLNRDADEMIARLDWEAAQIAKAGAGHEDRLAAAALAAEEAAAALSAEEAALSQLAEDVARLAARHQSGQRLLADARATLGRAEAEADRAAEAAEAAAEAEARAAADVTQLAQAREAAQAALAGAEDALAAAEERRAEMQSREAEARSARSAAEGELGALKAEAGALVRLVERESQAGHQLLDQVQVRPGHEAAFGAALGEDLRAPAAATGSGWRDLPGYDAVPPLPEGVQPLSDFVSAPPVLARRLALTGVVADRAAGEAAQAALRPGQRLVSAEGDLWRWDGFVAAAADAPTAAALRLKQLNRLVELKQDLEEAGARAEGARQAHEMLTREAAAAGAAESAAREARRAADRALAEAGRALSRAEAEGSVAGGKRAAAQAAEARHRADAEAAQAAAEEALAALEDLPDLDDARAEAEAHRSAVEAARAAMLARRSAHDEIRREGEARLKRRQEITREVSGWRLRLETAGKRMAELAERRAEAEDELAEAAAAPEELAERRAELDEAITAAEARRAVATDALVAAEAAARAAAVSEREAERLAGEAREIRARAEARLEAARKAQIMAADRIREEMEMEPSVLVREMEIGDLPPLAELETEIARLRRQREALGAVNLRAEEDARAVAEEHGTLIAEKADLEAAIAKLRAGIAGLNREGRERLLTAFEQVNGNFRTLFTHLFGGGEANLVLVESDDPLEAGLEIMCQPPGKKLSTLSLLSGGEQTLTALSLIFGVFLTNPAPICVLDEVDAPLDDANVTRFCDLLDEMTRRTDTRFLIITHHAVTMSRMDRLFGVTMQEQGVSQLVSVDLKRAEELVA
ncbi:chromosome segregation SMC family protein [Phaeovulum vinaykumarii]|uniref:Chromosome partition protein Smc n=1 Tax=Phaeovulum vinaykumarii TaxID=407234 RepID=A0A1N7K7U8_9RHOB|nr:AAA family ATPase [Phaeovulum vinaykumarii]SIS57665.1 condensin subunit Smc [Phaeovulum vinaykumarii]SOB93507.1 condensin subunit Smc [Phaeovulum vinaykumarii]